MFTLFLPLFNVPSLLFLAADFGFFLGAFACYVDRGDAIIPHTALLSHPESQRSDILMIGGAQSKAYGASSVGSCPRPLYCSDGAQSGHTVRLRCKEDGVYVDRRSQGVNCQSCD